MATSSVHTHKRSTVAGKQCAPQRGKSGTCFTMAELRHISTQFNKTLHKSHHRGGNVLDGTPNGELEPINISKHRNKMDLWAEIDSRMQHTTQCSTEMCWADLDTNTTEYVKSAFRPPMPHSWKANPSEWLSTSDIQNVMKQYEQSHKGFYFVGAVPVDFAGPHDDGQMGKCVVQALCAVRVKQWWKRGIRQVGIVYNLDAHDEPGSHWVSSFIDLQDCIVCYYDSFGAEPPYEIHSFLNNVSTQLSDFHDGQRCDVQTNHYRHQFKNTECGIYSMYFIATMLEGERTYDDFVQNGLNDTQMNAYRHTFYNTLRDYESKQTQQSLDGDGFVGGGEMRRRVMHTRCTTRRVRKKNKKKTRRWRMYVSPPEL